MNTSHNGANTPHSNCLWVLVTRSIAGLVLLLSLTWTGAAAGAPGDAAAAASQPLLGVSVNLVNVQLGGQLCADLPDFGPGKPGGPVLVYDCNYTNADNQRFVLERHGSYRGYAVVRVRNVADDLCLDLPDFGSVDGGKLVSEFDCRPPADDNQLFYAQPTEVSGAYQFVHLATELANGTRLCLDVMGFASGGNDTRLTVWSCSLSDDHLWAARPTRLSSAGTYQGTVHARTRSVHVRVEPTASARTLRAAPSGTTVNITCMAPGRTDAQQRWYRLATGGYVKDSLVRRAGPALPACDHPSEDLSAVLGRAQTFDEADAAWTTLGSVRQGQPGWKAEYARALKRAAQHQALLSAEIADDNWDPDRGLRAEDRIVRNVYEYYGRLWEQRPEEFQWAGMAKLAGATVYAGMQDLTYLVGSDKLNAGYVARKLMVMQKAIFEDLAWQHELYLHKGIAGMRAIEAGDPNLWGGSAGGRNTVLVGSKDCSVKMIDAWEDIASGSPERVDRGNRTLVAREQDPVLQPHYEELMRRASTWMVNTTHTARSPVPGDIRFRDIGYRYLKSEDGLNTILVGWHDDRSLPSVGWWEDRQRWVFGHMLPRYLELLHNERSLLKEQIERPVQDRASDYRAIDRHHVTHRPWELITIGVF